MPLKKNKDNKKVKLIDLFKEVYSVFKQKKFDFPEIETTSLLSFVLKKEKLFLLTTDSYLVSFAKQKIVNSLIKKRLAGWSLASLTGVKSFYNLELQVNKNVLIPRPETELLVDEVIINLNGKTEVAILDIGTGSGAIILSLFKNIKATKAAFYASDISEAALKVARHNAKKYQAKIKFLKGDLLKPYLLELPKIKPNNLVITANLPYLKPAEMKEKSISKEPKNALLSGRDGLWHYRRLFKQIKNNLLSHQKDIFLICEINPLQARTIKKLAAASFSTNKIYFKKDYRQKTRFIIIEI